MNRIVNNTLSARNTGNALVRLGASHGYQFNADTVRLSAMFTVLDATAHKHAWALQLWACPNAPVSRNELNGRLVAQVALPPIGEIADEVESFEVTVPAALPVGNTRREAFLHPRFNGSAGYRIEGYSVVLSASPRFVRA